MGVYKRKDSSYWWYNFTLNGRKYQYSTKIRNKRDRKQCAYLGGWADTQMVNRYSKQRQVDVSYLDEY